MTTKQRVVFTQERKLRDGRGIMAAQCIRAGNYVYISGQSGLDLHGQLVGLGDPASQARQACENICTLVEMAGGSRSAVVKLIVYMTDRAQRATVDSVIQRCFPEVGPCRTEYVVRGLGRDGLLVTLEAWAFVDDDRVRMELLRTEDGRTSRGPGVVRATEGYRAGNLVYLAGQMDPVVALDVAGPADPATQAHRAMGHLGTLMKLAGGSLGDVVRVVRAVTEREDRATVYPAIQSYWSDRPPPGTGLVVEGLAAERAKIQIDAWGFVDTTHARKRIVRTHDVTAAGMLGGVGRATQCVRAGNLVFIQGQVGWTLESELVALGDPAGQARQAMENIKTLMELAGGSLADIVRVVIYVTQPAVRDLAYPAISSFWNDAWPCGTDLVVKGLARPEMLIEIDAYGFIGDAD